MRYLLDTNVWILMVEKGLVSEKIDQIILDSENYPFGLSVISVWEVAKKVSLGKLSFSMPIRHWMQAATRQPFIEVVPLSIDVSLESTLLPGTFHKDPADQIIVATARIYNLTILTTDQLIKQYRHVNVVG